MRAIVILIENKSSCEPYPDAAWPGNGDNDHLQPGNMVFGALQGTLG